MSVAQERRRKALENLLAEWYSSLEQLEQVYGSSTLKSVVTMREQIIRNIARVDAQLNAMSSQGNTAGGT